MKPFARLEGRACLALIVLVVGAQPSHACYAPPPAQLVKVDEQIARAQDVSLAKAVRATTLDNWTVQFDFVVIKRLRGPDQPGFTLYGRAGSSGPSSGVPYDHGDGAFWMHGGGRTMNSSDCRIHPSFEVGEYYLVFNGQPTWRSYERIATVDGKPLASDQWLQYVEAKLAGKEVSEEWKKRANQPLPWERAPGPRAEGGSAK